MVKNNWKKFSYNFSVITWFALLQSSFLDFLHSFHIILFLTILTQMPSWNWYQKVTLSMDLSVNGKKQLKKVFPTSFSSLFQLQSCGQITSISYVLLRSFCFKQNLLNCLLQIVTRKTFVSLFHLHCCGQVTWIS